MDNIKTVPEIREKIGVAVCNVLDAALAQVISTAFNRGAECMRAKLTPALEELQQMDDVRERECSEAYEQGLHDGYERVLGLLKARGITVEL